MICKENLACTKTRNNETKPPKRVKPPKPPKQPKPPKRPKASHNERLPFEWSELSDKWYWTFLTEGNGTGMTCTVCILLYVYILIDHHRFKLYLLNSRNACKNTCIFSLCKHSKIVEPQTVEYFTVMKLVLSIYNVPERG